MGIFLKCSALPTALLGITETVLEASDVSLKISTTERTQENGKYPHLWTE